MKDLWQMLLYILAAGISGAGFVEYSLERRWWWAGLNYMLLVAFTPLALAYNYRVTARLRWFFRCRARRNR